MWLIAALYGGAVSRLHGMDVIPRGVVNALWAAPLAAFAAMQYESWNMVTAVAIIVFALSMAGKSIGHGNWISLGNVPPGEPERLEFLIKWLKPHLDTRGYCIAGLSLTGVVAVFPAVVATGSLWLFIAGMMKGPAYLIGHLVYPNEMVGNGPPYLKTATNWGEFITGAVVFLTLAVTWG